MIDNLFRRPLRADAFSKRPFGLLDPTPAQYLSNVVAIGLIENGGARARKAWQTAQLKNLFAHARERSAFWRKRIPTHGTADTILQKMPTLTRENVRDQAAAEGSLVLTETGAPLSSYASTGSTGVPVKVFVCPENGLYNAARSVTQYLTWGLDFTDNCVRLATPTQHAMMETGRRPVTSHTGWADELGAIFQNGPAKSVLFNGDIDAHITELLKEPVGVLISPSRFLEALFDRGGLRLFERLRIKTWLHMSDYRHPEIVSMLSQLGARSLSSYSSGETGAIAFECAQAPNHFHVVHTNVMVEADATQTVTVDGVELSKLLITHLQSYATPLIRYDIGDFGKLSKSCPCGHDGATISNIFGRGKHFLKHPGGRLTPFHISTRALLEAVSFDDCRIRQTSENTLRIELARRDPLSPEEEARLRVLLAKVSGPEFHVDITCVKDIDWSDSPKRLFFASQVP